MTFTAEIILLLVVGGLFAVVFACVTRWAAPVYFVGMLFASSISLPTEEGIKIIPTLISPLQTHRNYLFAASSLLLLINLVAHPRKYRPGTVPATVITMICAGVWMGLMITLQGDPINGIQTVVLTIVSLGAVAALLNQTPDYRSAAMLFAGCVLTTSCLINLIIVGQFAVNPTAMLSSEWSRRFHGLTGNPQFLGAQLAMIITICLWMLLSKMRLIIVMVLIPVIAMNCIFLAWTGSRTGLGMCVIGVSVVLFSRFKQAAIALPVAAVGVAVAYRLLGGLLSDIDTSRLTSLQNTRRGVFSRMMEIYLEHPMIGAGIGPEGADKSENSFLYSLATYGTGMGLLYILAVVTALALMLRLLRIRHRVGVNRKGMIDLVLALNGAFMAGTLLEGYFVGRVNVLILLFVGTNVVGHLMARQLSRQHSTLEVEDSQDHRVEADSPHAPSTRGESSASVPNYAELAY